MSEADKELLDRMAMAAMQAYCAHLTHGGNSLCQHTKEIAQESYGIAEAMIAERACRQDKPAPAALPPMPV